VCERYILNMRYTITNPRVPLPRFLLTIEMSNLGSGMAVILIDRDRISPHGLPGCAIVCAAGYTGSAADARGISIFSQVKTRD